MQVVRLHRLAVWMVAGQFAGCCKVASCKPENIVEGGGEVDLTGPDPNDRSVSKAKWEGSIQRWRNALQVRASDIRRIREGWPASR